MILHIGEDISVREEDVVLILNLGTSLTPDTQAYLQSAMEEGFVRSIGPDEAKTVVICQTAGKRRPRTTVYFTSISSATLLSRTGVWRQS